MSDVKDTKIASPGEVDARAGPLPDEVPVLPTRGAVIYPYLVVPLFVGRPRSIQALEAAMKENRRIALLAQRNISIDDPGPDDLYQVGTIGEIVQTLPLPDGTVRVMIEGSGRVRVKEYLHAEPFLRAHVEPLVEVEQPGIETEALVRNVIAQFERLINLGRNIPAEALESARRMSDPGRIADLIAYYAQIPVEVKQQVLEAASQRARLEILAVVLNREIEILEVERKISSRVKQELEESQKEFYLREKMKAIQHELGERDDRTSEIDELRARIKEAAMPEEVEERALKELDRLERMPPASPEVVVVRTYLDWLIAMPWSKRSDEKLDIVEAERILNEDHYGLKKVKERVLEFLALRKKTGSKKGAIIAFTGPPGVGKTSIAGAIAEALGRKFVRLSLGGVHDETVLRGHGRTYLGSMPGEIMRQMKAAGTVNPVMLMDEADKIGRNGNAGDPTAALLEILDPSQNNTYRDRYLDVPYDLSEVLFVVTSNELSNIPEPLRDRMEIIEFDGYTTLEKIAIAERHVVPQKLAATGLTPADATLTKDAIRRIIEGYTMEAGVRKLRQQIESVLRKISAWTETRGEKAPGIVNEKDIEKYLGVENFSPRQTAQNGIGVATGLAVNTFGGSTLNVEVSKEPGTGQLKLRQQFGPDIEDSAKNAYKYVKQNAAKYGLKDVDFTKIDIDINITPAGKVDGPSAGGLMVTAIISALTGRSVSPGLAMTGEITMRGDILPIGGLKQKVMAAHRMGYKEVIFPFANLKDIEDIPKEVRDGIKLTPARTYDDIYPSAIVPATPAK